MNVRVVKENKGAVIEKPLSVWALVAALAGTAAAVAALTLIDTALPEPLGPHNAPPDVFHADSAYKFLVNLTSIGPRVAGTYENEVLGMNAALTALREAERGASKHNRLLIDRHRASGAFELTFLDGMNNVYRGVQSVVARVEAVGSSPAAREPALLLNCHIDTVPDSPGASDDGAGCAVVVGAVRALLAGAAPLRRPVVALLNGAEENIMQASHAFITQHRWAADARVFLNLEACGAGGREVLFQAGPADPWLLDAYARHVPHPFASSVAQELFDSGLVPADTDFRVFRDFGGLSGLDLAWSANGYVYHTRLDTAERVGPAVLQRTGANVLALVRGLLASPAMDAPPDRSPPPVFFDVLGAAVATVPAPAAPALAAAALLLLPLKLHLSARDAQRHLRVPRRWWWAGALGAGGLVALAGAAGGAAALAAGAALHAARLRLPYFARPLLLAPLFAFPAVAATLLVFVALHVRASRSARVVARGAARLVGGAERGGRLRRGGRRAAGPGGAGAAALRVPARAVAGAARRRGRARRRAAPAARHAARARRRRRRRRRAADLLPGAGHAAAARAGDGARGRRRPAAARRRAGRRRRLAGGGRVRLGAAARAGRGRAPRAPAGRRAAGRRGAGGRAGRRAARARLAVRAGRAAAADGVPHAAHCGRRAAGDAVLGAGAGREHARDGGARDGRAARGRPRCRVRPPAVLRRAVLPARAELHPARVLGARPGPAGGERGRERVAGRDGRGGRGGRAAAAGVGGVGADARGGDRGGGGGRARDALLGGGRAGARPPRPRRRLAPRARHGRHAAGGAAVARPEHLLLLPARRGRAAGRVGARPGRGGAGRVRGAALRVAVGGGARAGRRVAAVAAAGGAAGVAAGLDRGHGLERGPAPARSMMTGSPVP